MDLILDVWGPAISITDRVVDQHVYFLRKKLGAIGGQIKSVYGAGYVFNRPKSK